MLKVFLTLMCLSLYFQVYDLLSHHPKASICVGKEVEGKCVIRTLPAEMQRDRKHIWYLAFEY